MSCIYGPRQMGTEDQGWVAHFLIRALEGEPISIYGDGRQVRDMLDVADAVDAYCAAWRAHRRGAGRAFNLGGGPGERHQPAPAHRPYRGRWSAAPSSRASPTGAPATSATSSPTPAAARAALGPRRPALDWRDGVAELAAWLERARPWPRAPAAARNSRRGARERGRSSRGAARPERSPLRLLMTADAVGGVWTYALDLAARPAPHGVETSARRARARARRRSAGRGRGVPGLRADRDRPAARLDGRRAEAETRRRRPRRSPGWRATRGVDIVHAQQLRRSPPARGFPAPGRRRSATPASRPGGGRSAAGAAAGRTSPGAPPGTPRARRAPTPSSRRPRLRATPPPSAYGARRAAARRRATAAPRRARRATEPRERAGLHRRPALGRRQEPRGARRRGGAARCAGLAAGPLEGPNGASVALQHAQALGALDADDGPALARARARSSPRRRSTSPSASPCSRPRRPAARWCSPISRRFRELWDGAAIFVPPGRRRGHRAALAELLDARPSAARARPARPARAPAATPSRRMAQGMLDVYARASRRRLPARGRRRAA